MGLRVWHAYSAINSLVGVAVSEFVWYVWAITSLHGVYRQRRIGYVFCREIDTYVFLFKRIFLYVSGISYWGGTARYSLWNPLWIILVSNPVETSLSPGAPVF